MSSCDDLSTGVTRSDLGRLAVQIDSVVLFTNLVLDEKLDTLNGSGGSLGDSGGDTSHCRKLLVIVHCGYRGTGISSPRSES